MKTLGFWIVWSSISVGVFIQLYQQADLWTFVIHDNTRVTWIILIAFCLGVLVSFVHIMLLTVDWFYAYKMQARLSSRGLEAACMAKRRMSSTTKRFLEAIHHISAAGGQVNLTDLSTVEFATHIRVSRFVGLLGSLLITLGLIGTVMGLTITLTGLNGALNNVGSDSTIILAGLSDALSGMGLAFYTTLLGAVMGGILLRVFAYISDNSIEALQDLLVRSCMVYASVELTPTVQRDFLVLDETLAGMDHRLVSLADSLQSSKQAMSEFAEEMRELNRSVNLSESDDEIFKAIAVHRHYAKVLRYELSLQKQLAGFKQRLLAAMGFQFQYHPNQNKQVQGKPTQQDRKVRFDDA
ncbi:MotA/TolQ/ExbB proton channel family protein [Mariprofundus ferrooxydans]|nr:MotA/TolQ/ExbB proton channel family protein [Mariprofundus ferrooxydans]